MAAKQNHAVTQLRLGLMYAYGIGESKSLKKAKFWIQKSRDNGSEESMGFWNKLELWKY